MPTCTGQAFKQDVWICPCCKSLKKPLRCIINVIHDEFVDDCPYCKARHGPCNNIFESDPCNIKACIYASVRHGNLTGHLKHMVKRHNWKVPGFSRKKKRKK